MNEHQRWFYRMNQDQRHDYSCKATMFWESMMSNFHREVPVEFARFQFLCAMELQKMQESRP